MANRPLARSWLAVAAADDLRENTRHWYEASQTMKTPLPPITLEDFNLEAAERRLCAET